MIAIDVIDHLARAGYDVRLSENPGKLLVTPSGVPEELLSLVREHKAEILNLLQADLPTDPESGARFMPWCAPIPADQFAKWRLDLIEMIEELAALDGWPRDHLDDVLARAVNGPVSDLRPNWHYFTGELRRARQQRAARIHAAEQTRQATNALFNRRESAPTPTIRGH